jgi:hypothetical protein
MAENWKEWEIEEANNLKKIKEQQTVMDFK